MSPRRLELTLSLGLIVVVGFLTAASYRGPESSAGTASPALPAPSTVTADGVREWLERSAQACAQVRDYRCVLTTRERVKGRLQPEQTMDLALRTTPFAVHLRFRAPASSAGQEVWFGRGLHGEQLRVRPAGYFGALTGMMTLDPHGPMVRENSRHAITDAGFAHMLERFTRACRDHPDEVTLGSVPLEDRPCRRIDLTLCEAAEWKRASLWIDGETHLPVRVEYVDAEGRLLDEATYRQIETNLGLGDGVFGG